jgi:hypothetical protein
MKGGVMVLKARDLNVETQRKLGLIEGGRFRRKKREKTVPDKIIVYGKVLMRLKGLTRRDALWVLRRAAKEL